VRSGVPAHTDSMPVRLHQIVVGAHDLPELARFWAQALGWKILAEREREIVIGTDEYAPAGVCFMAVTDPKTVKNRVHLDLTSSAQDRDQEIERLLPLGARRAGIGQTGAESWTVLADPEGNEFWLFVANAAGHYSRGSSESILDVDLTTILRRKGGARELLDLVKRQFGRIRFTPVAKVVPVCHAHRPVHEGGGLMAATMQ
jgi:catechol-2,3-dioxygenase